MKKTVKLLVIILIAISLNSCGTLLTYARVGLLGYAMTQAPSTPSSSSPSNSAIKHCNRVVDHLGNVRCAY